MSSVFFYPSDEGKNEGDESVGRRRILNEALTQDYVVWEETNEVDLRKIASDRFQTPGHPQRSRDRNASAPIDDDQYAASSTCTTTTSRTPATGNTRTNSSSASSSPSSSDSKSGGSLHLLQTQRNPALKEVSRRCLDSASGAADAIADDIANGADEHRTREGKLGTSYAPEKEIDGIFRRLDGDTDDNSGIEQPQELDVFEVPTPPRVVEFRDGAGQIRQRHQQPPQQQQIIASKRNSRRQRLSSSYQQAVNDQTRKRLRRDAVNRKENMTNLDELNDEEKNHLGLKEQLDSDDFEDLLREVETPNHKSSPPVARKPAASSTELVVAMGTVKSPPYQSPVPKKEKPFEPALSNISVASRKTSNRISTNTPTSAGQSLMPPPLSKSSQQIDGKSSPPKRTRSENPPRIQQEGRVVTSSLSTKQPFRPALISKETSSNSDAVSQQFTVFKTQIHKPVKDCMLTQPSLPRTSAVPPTAPVKHFNPRVPSSHYSNLTQNNDPMKGNATQQNLNASKISPQLPPGMIAKSSISSHNNSHVPLVSNSVTQLQCSSTSFETNDEEFGDIDLTMDDLAEIDNLVIQATQSASLSQHHESPPRRQHAAERGISHRSQSSNPSVSSQAGSVGRVLQYPCHSTIEDKSCDDSLAANGVFDDDFPEIDYDELDKSIALHSTQTQSMTQLPSVSSLVRDVQTLGKMDNEMPPLDFPVRNPRVTRLSVNSSLTFLTLSRYKIIQVKDTPGTRTLYVAAWTKDMAAENKCRNTIEDEETPSSAARRSSKNNWDGLIHLRGEWCYTEIDQGDIIHICSLYGQFRTDVDALPLILHTQQPHGSDEDDLVMVVHPDLLLTPTAVSDAVSCIRRSVLGNRLGSSGLTAKAALFGTIRHGLFEEAMKLKDFSIEPLKLQVKRLVRKNAEGLLACGVSSREAELEITKFIPQLQRFAATFTNFGLRRGELGIERRPILEPAIPQQPQVRFVVDKVESVEEPMISPELGMKGNVDMVISAVTAPAYSARFSRPKTTIMGVELKTGHFQSTQMAHSAQLAMYTLMLQTRYGAKIGKDDTVVGATRDGLLLYMNNEALRAVHLAPLASETKSLIGQRNHLAVETLRATRPRSVQLSYEPDGVRTDRKKTSLDFGPAILPGLERNVHMCRKCYANRQCMMYAAVSNHTKGSNLKNNETISKGHEELMVTFTGHLNDDDFAYFQKWDRLIDLEADASASTAAEAWLIPSDEREQTTSRCISSVYFDPSASTNINMFDDSCETLIAFKRSDKSPLQTPLHSLGFAQGTHVIISIDATTIDFTHTDPEINKPRPFVHMVRGSVVQTTDFQVVIKASLDDLVRVHKFVTRPKGRQEILFRIDRDEIASGMGTLRQNLVNLFTRDKSPEHALQSFRLSWLRDVIVRLKSPVFDESLKTNMFAPDEACPEVPGCDPFGLAVEYAELNDNQRSAVDKVFTSRDYCLIQGLPGTGKTSVIAFVVRLLAAHGKRVLVTSYTHSAVDNVMLKLMENGVASTSDNLRVPALVRIGQKSSTHPEVCSILASTVAANMEASQSSVTVTENSMPSADSLRRAVSSARVVGVTALSVPRSPLLVHENFDVVIVDEAGQITQPAVLGALMAADSFVLVGDHMQLPPLVASDVAEEQGFGVSMLKHLAEAQYTSVARLRLQYRMNSQISQLSNDIVYNGTLVCANDEVRNRKLSLPSFPFNVKRRTSRNPCPWLMKAVDPESPVVFINTDLNDVDGPTPRLLECKRSSAGGGVVNHAELSIVRQVVDSLLTCGMNASSIGIICPFRAQLRIMSESASFRQWKEDGLELSTIDRYQGRDKDAIVISFVRSNSKGKVGRLLEDFRRLNVAVTRAKCKLVMIGSFSTLYSGSLAFRPALDRVKNCGHLVSAPVEF